MKALALVGKDARILARNRPLLVALLVYPFVLALVLGAAFQEPPSTLALVVVDDDAGSVVEVAGENLTTEDLILAAEPFADIVRVETLDDAVGRLRRGEADAVLHIPRGFLGDLAALGTNATMRLVVDESDPIRAGVAENAVEGAVDSFIEVIIQKKIDDIGVLIETVIRGGNVQVGLLDVDLIGIDEATRRLEAVEDQLPPGSDERARVTEVIDFMFTTRLALGSADRFLTTTAIPLRVETEGLASADTSLAAIALPGAVVLGVFWTGSLAAALLVARERETGVARRLAASPAATWLQTASKTLVAVLAALVPAAALVALGVAAFGLRVGDPALAAVVLLLTSLAAAALGGLCAAIARATSGAALLAVLALLPMILLGGLFYPVAYMPAAAQAVSRLLPVTLATDALRGALLRGSSATELAFALGGLAAFTLLSAAAGAALAQRR